MPDEPDWMGDLRRNANNFSWLAQHYEALYGRIKHGLLRPNLVVDVVEALNLIFPYVTTRDDYQRWEPLLFDALFESQTLKDDRFQMQVWLDLGRNYLLCAKHQKAIGAFENALGRGSTVESPELKLLVQINLFMTNALNHRGQYDQHAREILTLGKIVNDSALLAMMYYALAFGYMLHHEIEKALGHGQTAYAIWHMAGSSVYRFKAAMLLADVCRTGSYFEQARRFLDAAGVEALGQEHSHERALYAYHQGSVHLECQKPREAERWYETALARLLDLDYPYLTSVTHQALAIAQIKLARYDEAVANLRAALGAWRRMDNFFEAVRIYQSLGFGAESRGQMRRALYWYLIALERGRAFPDSPAVVELRTDVQQAIDRIRKMQQG